MLTLLHFSLGYGEQMNQYGQPGAPMNQYGQPGAPMNQYGQPGVPMNQYGQPGAPVDQYGQPMNQYGQPGAPVMQQPMMQPGMISTGELIVLGFYNELHTRLSCAGTIQQNPTPNTKSFDLCTVVDFTSV